MKRKIEAAREAYLRAHQEHEKTDTESVETSKSDANNELCDLLENFNDNDKALKYSS